MRRSWLDGSIHLGWASCAIDAYPLALAVHHDGRFITFDERVARSAVPAATTANLTVL